MKKVVFICMLALAINVNGQEQSFNGLNNNLSNLYRTSNAKTRSISPENFTGEKGKGAMAKLGKGAASEEARDLGQGWKVSPYIIIQPGETFPLAEIEGPGSIQHIWMTPTGNWRFYILRFYWDDEKEPSVEVPEDAAYFHAQFRSPDPDKDKEAYTIVDNIKGKGQYVGTYIAWQVNNNGWWGEGEIKFYMDGDKKFPTIAGTGTEDYFCGSYNFDVEGQYTEYSTPYAGLHQVIRPDGTYSANTRFGLYRWHITDPVRFEKDLKITIQDLGWRSGRRYLKQGSKISSVAYRYQMEPHNKFPELPSKDDLEVR